MVLSNDRCELIISFTVTSQVALVYLVCPDATCTCTMQTLGSVKDYGHVPERSGLMTKHSWQSGMPGCPMAPGIKQGYGL